MLDTRAGGDLHSVLLMVLEAVQRGGGFDRVLFGLVTPDKQTVQGRAAIGSRSEPLKDLFTFPLSVRGGPIGVALARQQELLLRADWELRPDEAALLAHFGARLIGVLPLSVANVLVGCLYFDRVGFVGGARHPRSKPACAACATARSACSAAAGSRRVGSRGRQREVSPVSMR